VPPELESVGRCVRHFLNSVEQTCAEMHREIVLHGVDVERQAAVGKYVCECTHLLARVICSLRLTDELKRRILTSFLSLMNLRETLDRVCTVQSVAQRSSGLPAVTRRATVTLSL